MNHDDERIQQLLKQSIPPAHGELERDLWPQMLERLGQQPAITVPWFDWALVAAVLLLILLAPRSLPLLLYHL
jgi:hypothetical protein